MIRMAKENNKNKALSSYLLSGINIRKMIADESVFPQNVSNISEFNVIKISKRPIFKIQTKDRQEDLNSSNLTNKTFKIRSFTKKLRNDYGVNMTENHQIFQKVTNLRNLRSVSNRIELFNISALSKFNKYENKDCKKQSVEITENGQAKIRNFGKQQASAKCRIGSQIFIQQPIQEGQEITQRKLINEEKGNRCTLKYHNFQTQKFRDMAGKVNFFINEKYRYQKNSITIILSLDCLVTHSKRVVKSNSFVQQQNGRCEKNRSKFSVETIELIKLLCCNSYNDEIKLMFKVNNASQLQQLKGKLLSHQIDDYYCIFYSNRRYIETWDFYIIDQLHIHQQLILIQNWSQLNYSLPIISNQTKILFITTHNPNFMALSRIIRSIKSFLYYQLRNQSGEESSKKEVEESIFQDANLLTQTFSNDLSYLQAHIQQCHLNINANELKARFDFTNDSRQIKGLKTQKAKKSSSSSAQRRVLCDRTNNISVTQDENAKEKQGNHYESKPKNNFVYKSCQEQIGSSLLSQFRSKSANKIIEVSFNIKGQGHSKNQQLEQITNYVNGFQSKSKSVNQIISQLTRKNQHICKQIGQFVSKTDYLATSFKHAFSSQDCLTKKMLSVSQIEESFEKIIIYKIH